MQCLTYAAVTQHSFAVKNCRETLLLLCS